MVLPRNIRCISCRWLKKAEGKYGCGRNVPITSNPKIPYQFEIPTNIWEYGCWYFESLPIIEDVECGL